MWLVQRAPFVPIGSFEIWTMISCPSRTTSRMGVDLEIRFGTAPLPLLLLLRPPLRFPSRPPPPVRALRARRDLRRRHHRRRPR